ncbi:MAG: folylpolyglutamate synthase/dihydrofolate synthase family protein [Vicinamibacterales bacterium]
MPLEFLFSLERLGMKFGLENMEKICAALGHPERAFGSVIVAGTNGKGSVTAMTSAALHAAGYRSARYTSPHLERIEERFVIGEREVSTADLESAAASIQSTVERLVADRTLETLPTFFECTTAIAFELFRRANVEVAVVEVGLGGRLDATNVITPMAAVITSIDFDHQDLLGETLESIAREKAGVIKPGIPVIVGPVVPGAHAVIADACRERSARLIDVPDRVRVSTRETRGAAANVTLEAGAHRLEDVTLALPGRHQVDNAAVAFCLFTELVGLGVRLTPQAMRTGLSEASWPGRLEYRRWRDAEVILDAAHNTAGARALATYLRERDWTGVTLVLGVMRDKDATGMLSELLPCCRTLICTTAPSPRALDADSLAALASSVATRLPSGPPTIVAIADPARAVADACQPGARVVAAGSIFLIGPLRGILR